MKKNIISYVISAAIALPLGGVGGGLLYQNEGKDSKKKRKSQKIKGKTCHRQELNGFKQKLSYKETGRGMNIKKGHLITRYPLKSNFY